MPKPPASLFGSSGVGDEDEDEDGGYDVCWWFISSVVFIIVQGYVYYSGMQCGVI